MSWHIIWLVYIAFNYLSLSLVELNKILHCGHLSLGANSLLRGPSCRHSNFIVNLNHIFWALCACGHIKTLLVLDIFKGMNKTVAARLLEYYFVLHQLPPFTFRLEQPRWYVHLSVLVHAVTSTQPHLHLSVWFWLLPLAVLVHIFTNSQHIIIFIE